MANPVAPMQDRRSVLPHSLIVLLTLAAAVVALAGLYLGRELFGPLAIAAVIVIICSPIRGPLERRGWPKWLATTAVILLSYAILLAMALMLAYAGARFAELVVEYLGALQKTLENALGSLSSLGLEQQASDALNEVLKPSALIGFATSLGNYGLGIVTALFFVFAYVIFMAADASRYSRAHVEYGPSAAAAMTRFQAYNSSVRRYYVVNATFGLIVAAVDGIALFFMGVPAALVWAILAFVTNFVPNIGFILGLIPPMLMALVVGGVPLMLGVIVVYIVANVVLQVLVQPKFVSDAVNLSLTLSFFSVLFWTFIVGPLGAILSIPLTLLARALVLEGDPQNRWFLWLTGDSNATEEAPPDTGKPEAKVVSAQREPDAPAEDS